MEGFCSVQTLLFRRNPRQIRLDDAIHHLTIYQQAQQDTVEIERN